MHKFVYEKNNVGLIISFVFQSCVLCRVFVCIVHFCHHASSCLLSFGFYSLSIFMVLFWYGFWSIVSFELSFFPFWRPSPKCPLSIVSKVFCLLYFVSRIFSWSLSVSCLVLFLVLCLLSPVSLVFCLLYLLYCLLCLLSFICWLHTSYLSRAHGRCPCKFFLLGVNFSRLYAKHWPFYYV